ncbi:hypothetical protein [Blattabacterium cuenoti]|uniref:hypothetical protein n=1 Tax=Blattabacterium cuenoti TaxID=1653831 RepID=UPI00311D2ED4
MNTSFRFLILTIFIALGFITSCNDDITSTEEDTNGLNTNTNIASTDTSSIDDDPNEPPPYNADEIDKINPEELSKQIKEIGGRIEVLEKASTQYFDEYNHMAEIQKGILENIKIKKMIMRSKTVGSEEEKIAKIDFENEKKFGKEKLQILKEKNNLLYKLTKSIAEAKNEKEKLQKKHEYLLKRKKEKAKLN